MKPVDFHLSSGPACPWTNSRGLVVLQWVAPAWRVAELTGSVSGSPSLKRSAFCSMVHGHPCPKVARSTGCQCVTLMLSWVAFSLFPVSTFSNLCLLATGNEYRPEISLGLTAVWPDSAYLLGSAILFCVFVKDYGLLVSPWGAMVTCTVNTADLSSPLTLAGSFDFSVPISRLWNSHCSPYLGVLFSRWNAL